MSLSVETMQSLMKHINFNDLPHQSLIDIINDLQESIKNKNNKYELLCNKLKEKDRMIEENQFDISDLKSQLETKERQLESLEKQVKDLDNVNRELKDQLSEYIYAGDPPAGEVPDIGQADDHSINSDEEIESLKMTNFTEFLQRCCIWSNVQIKVRCQMTKQFYHVAPSSCREIYDAFKEWCLRNNIIPSLAQNKNIPSTKQFFSLLVDGHRERYPDDWCQNGEQWPRSPNGSYKTPRVNLKLKPDFIEC